MLYMSSLMSLLSNLGQHVDPLKVGGNEWKTVENVIEPSLGVHVALHQGGGDDPSLSPSGLQDPSLHGLMCLCLTPQLYSSISSSLQHLPAVPLDRLLVDDEGRRGQSGDMVAYKGHDDRRLVVQLSIRIVSKLVILSDDLAIMFRNYKFIVYYNNSC